MLSSFLLLTAALEVIFRFSHWAKPTPSQQRKSERSLSSFNQNFPPTQFGFPLRSRRAFPFPVALEVRPFSTANSPFPPESGVGGFFHPSMPMEAAHFVVPKFFL